MTKWLLISLTAGVCAISEAARQDDEVARDAAVQWLQLVDAGRNDEAASQASAETRSFEQWQKYFTDHRAPLGRVHNRQFLEVKHQPTFPGAFQVRKYYVIRFKTSFERRPGTIEEIALTKIGCCWEIFEYEISDK